LEKRLPEFQVLAEALRGRAYLDIPKLPPKTLLAVKNPEILEKRQTEVLNFLRVLIDRRDTRNS
jgi:hypothetical protein